MTREEALKVIQLNRDRMNGSVQAALGVLLPELDAPQQTVLTWRTCKAGDRLSCEALIRYRAYVEIGWYAKGDGEWVPTSEVGNPYITRTFSRSQLKALALEQREKAIAEGRTCKTCAYWNGSADSVRLGYCEKCEPALQRAAEDTCEYWERYEEPGKAVEGPRNCRNCRKEAHCFKEDTRWGGPCEDYEREEAKK